MTENVRLRMTLLGVLVFGLLVALSARLWYLQVVAEETYVVQARANLERTVPIPATRGRILDANGRVLVGNRVTNLVSVDKFVLFDEAPTKSEQEDIALRLAQEISQTGRLIKYEAILDAFYDPRYEPFSTIPIATDVTEEFAILLGERLEDFPGVEVSPTTVREYPFGNLAVHVLGTIGPIIPEELSQLVNHPKDYSPNDDIGKTGIERSFEDILRGQPGQRVVEVDAQNRVVNVLEDVDPIAGADVQLSIDIDVQRMVEEQLRLGIEKARTQTVKIIGAEEPSKELHKATGGAVVLLDPDGAKVIAMASYPTFDPEPFIGGISTEEFKLLQDPAAFAPLFNRATAAAYSPGSTFKPFTSYAAMDTGMLGDRGFLGQREFLEDGGVFRIPGCDTNDCRFQNAGAIPYGDVDLEKAIAVSSDVYYYQIAYQFDVRSGFSSDAIQTAARLFGFGRASGIQLPEDSPGRIPTAETKDGVWTAGDTINISIGQGDVGVTPLQMANAYGVLANGGTLYAPQLVERIIDQVTDEPIDIFDARVVDEIYFPDWMRDPIIRGLEGVITYDDPDSTNDGTAFKLFGDFPKDRWSVAGKTGTIENAPKQDSSAFAAFAPVDDPEYVVFAYVEEGGFGAAAAGPIVKNVLERLESGDIAEAPTAAEIEEYYRNVLLGEVAEDGDAVLPTGDVLTDITLGPLTAATPTPEPVAEEPAVGEPAAGEPIPGSTTEEPAAEEPAEATAPPVPATLVPATEAPAASARGPLPTLIPTSTPDPGPPLIDGADAP